MTILFNGFPVTSANPPQIQFSGANRRFNPANTEPDSAQLFASLAGNNPATQQRLVNFFTANAAPRAAYVANLNNLISGLQTVQNGGIQNQQLATAVSSQINRLRNAVNGLNANPPVVPNVLGLYKQVSRLLTRFSNAKLTNTTQTQALDTLTRSTLPIGLTNYFIWPTVLSQPATAM
jgi:hypothetical protein